MPVLVTNPSAKVIDGVTIALSGHAYDTDLTMVGAALYQRKVAIIKVKVSVEQILLSAPEKFVRTDAEAASSAALSEVFAIMLTLLRTVDGDTVRSGFADALMANNLDENEPNLKEFLGFVANGEYAQGSTATVLVKKEADKCLVVCESSNGMSGKMIGGADLGRKILSIWLGIPGDSGAAEAKKNILDFHV